MISALLDLVLAHKQAAAIGLLVVTTAVGALAWLYEHDRRVADRAIAERIREDFIALDTAYQRTARALEESNARRVQDSVRIAELADSAAAAVSRAREHVEEASTRAVEAGESIRATLDSLTHVERLQDAHRLASVLQEQWAKHEAGDEALAAAEAREDSAQAAELRAQREATELEREGRIEERAGRIEAETALSEAREALQARIEAGRAAWYDHWTVKAGALGLAAVAGWEAREAF